jgi:hypothetical protein
MEPLEIFLLGYRLIFHENDVYNVPAADNVRNFNDLFITLLFLFCCCCCSIKKGNLSWRRPNVIINQIWKFFIDYFVCDFNSHRKILIQASRELFLFFILYAKRMKNFWRLSLKGEKSLMKSFGDCSKIQYVVRMGIIVNWKFFLN